MSNPYFIQHGTPEQRRETARAQKIAAKQAEDRRVAIGVGFIVVPFVALVGSGLIWVTALIWMNMPWW